MKKGMINPLILIISLLAFTPILIYWWHFHNNSLSNDTQLWGSFGDYLNGTFTPVVALGGVVVTLLLGLISERNNEANKAIEQQKSRPLLHIGYHDSENKLRIFMKNKGNGPLLISEYYLIDNLSKQKYPGLWECLPVTKIYYSNYTGNQDNTVLSPEEEFELMRFEGKDGDADFENDKESIRRELGRLKIIVIYKDVFNNLMPTYERSLAWFSRHDSSLLSK